MIVQQLKLVSVLEGEPLEGAFKCFTFAFDRVFHGFGCEGTSAG